MEYGLVGEELMKVNTMPTILSSNDFSVNKQYAK